MLLKSRLAEWTAQEMLTRDSSSEANFLKAFCLVEASRLTFAAELGEATNFGPSSRSLKVPKTLSPDRRPILLGGPPVVKHYENT